MPPPPSVHALPCGAADSYRVPRPLRRGDTVAVVAPSGPVDSDLLAAGLEHLRAWGLSVEVMPHVQDRANGGLLAGHDAARAGDLQEAWCRDDVAAVFCARGGYGATRVLEHLDWSKLSVAAPKWLVGSSDVTALHQAFGRRLAVVSAFGPMVATSRFAASDLADESVTSLQRLLFGDVGSISLSGGPVMVRGDPAVGRLIGGNLALLTAMIGTPEAVPAAGSVAFLEDVGERPYRVDRMLTQLIASGWLAGVRGVALGTFWECGDVDAVLCDRLSGLEVPVVTGFSVGHGPRQLSLPLGATVQLDADQGRLQVLRPEGAPP